jgi:hypothetical protein
MLEGTLLYASQVAKGAVAVWFVSWAFRRKYELDQKLDWKEQIIRWVVVVIAFGLTLLGGLKLSAVRVIAWILGTAFLAWPNLAHHSMNVVEHFYPSKQSPREAGGPDPGGAK